MLRYVFLFSEESSALAAPRIVDADVGVNRIKHSLDQPLSELTSTISSLLPSSWPAFPSFLKAVFGLCQLPPQGDSSFVRRYDLTACQ